MLRLVFAIPALAAAFLAIPARAQTYDPRGPVCMHIYGDLEGDRIDCAFNSLEECRVAAFGRPAMCLINPYYAGAASQTRPAKTGRRAK